MKAPSIFLFVQVDQGAAAGNVSSNGEVDVTRSSASLMVGLKGLKTLNLFLHYIRVFSKIKENAKLTSQETLETLINCEQHFF